MVVVSIDIIYYLRRKKKNGIAGGHCQENIAKKKCAQKRLKPNLLRPVFGVEFQSEVRFARFRL